MGRDDPHFVNLEYDIDDIIIIISLFFSAESKLGKTNIWMLSGLLCSLW